MPPYGTHTAANAGAELNIDRSSLAGIDVELAAIQKRLDAIAGNLHAMANRAFGTEPETEARRDLKPVTSGVVGNISATVVEITTRLATIEHGISRLESLV